MKFRYIKHNEIIRETDEFHDSNNGQWTTFKKYYGKWWEELGYDKGTYKRNKGSVAMRRKIESKKNEH